MKVEKNFKRKIMLLGIFVLLLTSCGGGGGGGGGGSSNLPIKPSTPLIPGKPSVPKFEVEDVKVGIFDSDFLTNKDKIEAKYKNIEILNRDPTIGNPSTDDHGETVLAVLREDADFGVIAASIGATKKADKEGEKDEEIIVPTSLVYQQVLARMNEKGIKVFNQSFGTPEQMLDPIFGNEGSRIATLGTSLEDGKKIYEFYRDTVRNKKGVFIWAAGNSEENNASLEAGLPHYYPDLEKGWISVVGVNTDDDIQTNKTGKININHYYNPNEKKETKLSFAGEAKWWSIASNFRSLEFIIEGEKYVGIGSSYAAPRVSRAVALVAEEYPWMTPDQIRQTLFTTTDRTEIAKMEIYQRRTEKIPDDEYGWGMLNTRRALDGPGAFINTLKNGDNSTFVADIPNGMDSIFSNNIWGDGGLDKRGRGKLVLEGNNSYTGGSIIREGTLAIKKIHAGGVVVKSAGTLELGKNAKIGYNNAGKLINDKIISDENIIAANVDNYGTVKFDGSGAIIGGNYTAYPGSITQAGFDDNVKVRGIYKNSGQLKVLSKEYVSGIQKGTIISADGVDGTVNEVIIEGMKKASAKVAGGDIVVELSRQNPVDYIGNAEESSKNVAQNVENVFADLDEKVKAGTASQEELVMAAAMQSMSTSTFTTATEKMSGEIYASAQALTFSQAQNINRDLSNRLAGLDNLKLSNGETQAWFSAIGSDGKLRRDGYASADTRVAGGQFGLDRKFSNNTNLGVALAYSHAKADFNRYAGNSKSDMVGISLYGKKELADNFYTAGRIGISHVSTKVERELIDGLGNTVQGRVKHDDIMSSVYLEVGKSFKWLTPFVGYSQDYLRRGSFSESNAAWGIHADSKNYWNSNFLVGLRAEFMLDKYKFQSYITQAINVGKRDLAYDGHFTGSTVKQRYQGVKQAKNTTWLGVGVFREITPNFGVYGNVDFRVEDGKRADSVFSAGLQYKF
ncbi:autotransporter serine protease fusolisin [Fusobacterium russii]|uniref:autotransporter serine protease fusolisin n=1 Tax=Fusobacterium russii TaxID=854 RepID=UPI0003A1DA5C|nr:autotransporter serine protease fusolisin [Fusobacterium russii]